MKNYYSLCRPKGEVLQAARILNLFKNSLKNIKYFSYYLLFILSKLKEAKVKLYRHYECTPCQPLLLKLGTGSDQPVAKESTITYFRTIYECL